MNYKRMSIEIESPEEMGYDTIEFNLAESSIRDRALGDYNLDLNKTVLAYTEHRGIVPLREAIMRESSLGIDDVLVTTGAAMALFLIATTLLEKDDHIIVIRPNYATNLETPRAIGCEMTIVDLDFDTDFSLNTEGVLKAINAKTKLISITNPHNPTGVLFPLNTIKKLIKIAEKHNCYLLIDETYRELNFKSTLNPYAAELSKNVISVSSLSKAYGVPGIRTGWLITQDKTLMHNLLAAKEQIILGNSVLDEAVALHILNNKKTLLPLIHQQINVNYIIFKTWFNQQKYLEWVEPQAGVVCFPRLKKEFNLAFNSFKKALYEDYKTVVGFGHWFEQSSIYFRMGFGFPTEMELKEGLIRFEKCLSEHVYTNHFS
jgi:aspartate/methionine/tyrosine aminotransferase